MDSLKWVRFDSLADQDRRSFSIGPFGSAITKDNYVASGVPVVRGVNLSRGRFLDDGFVFISDAKADELWAANLAPGDMVFTHRGTIGQVTTIPRRPKFERYVLSSSQVKARLNPSVAVPEYYYYWFSSIAGRASLIENASTVGVPGIASPLSTIRSLIVPCPPVREQADVARLLGSLDDKIAANSSISNCALSLGAARYAKASRSAEWKTITLGAAAVWRSGGTPKTSDSTYWSGEVPWISALSLKSPWIDESERRLTELGVRGGTRLAAKDSVLFVVRGSSLKDEFRIGITQREVAFGQDCKALTPIAGIDAHLLFHAIRCKTGQILDLVEETGIGAGRLATDLMANLSIRIPPSVSDRTVEMLRKLDAMAAQRKVESRVLAGLRDTLLPKLLSGQLHIRDAEKIVEDST